MRRDNPRYHSNCRICGLSEALTLPHGEGLITDGGFLLPDSGATDSERFYRLSPAAGSLKHPNEA
jgi:hypothetical protein